MADIYDISIGLQRTGAGGLLGLQDPVSLSGIVKSQEAKAGRPHRMGFHVVYTYDGRWWTAEAPFLRGAYSQGRTRPSALRNLLSAISDLLETYAQRRQEPPFAAEVAVDVAEIDR